MSESYGGISKSYICPQCGKSFLVPYQSKGGGKTEWAYSRHNKKKKQYFCSYSCIRQAQAQNCSEVKII